MSCCTLFFSVLIHSVCKWLMPLDTVYLHPTRSAARVSNSWEWNRADLEGLFEHIFPSPFWSPRVATSLLEFPIENHTGESVGAHMNNMASGVFSLVSWMQCTLIRLIQGLYMGDLIFPNDVVYFIGDIGGGKLQGP